AVRAEAADERRFGPVGTDHHSDLAERRREYGRLGARRIADSLVSEFLFAVFADELAVRPQEDGGVVTGVAVGLQHAGDQVNLQLAGQCGQAAEVHAAGDRLAEPAVFLKRDALVGNGVAVEEAFGRTNDLCPLPGRLADKRLDAAIVRLL